MEQECNVSFSRLLRQFILLINEKNPVILSRADFVEALTKEVSAKERIAYDNDGTFVYNGARIVAYTTDTVERLSVEYRDAYMFG